MNTNTPLPTDSLRALARRFDLTVADLREMASNLDIDTTYAKSRRTWVLNTDATTVRIFNDFLMNR